MMAAAMDGTGVLLVICGPIVLCGLVVRRRVAFGDSQAGSASTSVSGQATTLADLDGTVGIWVEGGAFLVIIAHLAVFESIHPLLLLHLNGGI